MKKLRSRKIVHLSIRSKILFLVTFISVSSLITFLVYSTGLFSEDKKAYIFESGLNNSLTISYQLENVLHATVDKAKIMANISNLQSNDDILDKIISTDRSILSFAKFKPEQTDFPNKTRYNLKNIKRLKLKSSDLENLNQTQKPDFRFTKVSGFEFKIFNLNDQLISRLTFFDKQANRFYQSFQEVNSLAQSFSQSVFRNFLLDNFNRPIIDSKSSGEDDNLYGDSFLKNESVIQILKNSLNHGVKEVTYNSEELLLSFVKIPGINFKILSIIPKSTIYSVVNILKKKSLAFAIFLISLSIMLGTFLARSLNIPIETLMAGTAELAKGNFEHRIDVQSRDELSVLSNSFNSMSKKILNYMEEVKDKVRMEDELAVAQLVQSSFFPSDNIQYKSLSLAGYYNSASECGGDWWGCDEIDNKVLIFIGDATGHGVPSALITATANCCFNLLQSISKNEPELISRPDLVLNLMNEAIYKVGGKILMTFFIAIFDHDTNKLTYSNASHNPPYMYKFNPDESPSKKDIKLLMDNNGPRLGHLKDAEYECSEIEMTSNDVLLLFSDGIVEAENDAGKQWGERRFIKSFLNSVAKSPEEIKDNIIADAFEFYNGIKPDDDVTMVIAKRTVNDNI